jgi:excisionase family DNA binding protein
MAMKTWETLAGVTLRYAAPPEDVAEFVTRLRADVDNDAVTLRDFIDLLYGRENPVLDQTIFPSRGAVVAETLSNPYWHVMTDLLERKRLALGDLDLDAVAAKYCVPVSAAAKRLGVTPAAVRLAIQDRRLPAMKRGSRYYLSDSGLVRFIVAGHGASEREHFIPLAGAAKRLGVSTSALRRAISEGRLAAKKVGRRYLLTERAVKGYQVAPRFAAKEMGGE